jgi:hypothetical protein
MDDIFYLLCIVGGSYAWAFLGYAFVDFVHVRKHRNRDEP